MKRRQWRMLKDRIFAWSMAVGGISVIIAILMIFFYLFWVVVPLFSSAEIALDETYDLANVAEGVTPGELTHLSLEEYGEIAFSVATSGNYAFFDTRKQQLVSAGSIVEGAETVTGFSAGDPSTRAMFVALSNGRARVLQPEYTVTYPDDVRKISPSLAYPVGEETIDLGHEGNTVTAITGQLSEEQGTIVSINDAANIVITHLIKEVSFLDDEVTVEVSHKQLDMPLNKVKLARLDIDQRELYLVTENNELILIDIQNKQQPKLIDRVGLQAKYGAVSAIEFLAGGISLLVGHDSGYIAQWFPVRDENNNYTLTKIREFTGGDAPITKIVPEYFRKGFVATDQAGTARFYHTTAERLLISRAIAEDGLAGIAIGPRADTLLTISDDGAVSRWHIDNEHPEVSTKSLWQEVWYESRDKPEYIWQSSSASSDFEPKFSLTPLTFGTIKAAFYAMLFAMPLAIMGAVYTAYFMTPKMRAIVKPSVEVMAALPTVILGFLAGLWLAPLIERFLPGTFLSFICVPLAFVVVAYAYDHLPRRFRAFLPNGWEAAALIPFVCAVVWVCFAISPSIESAFFDGNMPRWISENLGLAYDQRNSLVVGMAIGFAVIPTIFSISEDAVFGVPKHLTSGSLALGATPWQTVVGVVLLTASPGIFSAVMIGLGRAVGETMIVLMATGNTPIMDINIFQGFRALSANIAVEMPESEVDSTHYRILFLAALVLFAVTFVFNTVAEIVRQRLREKYSNL